MNPAHLAASGFLVLFILLIAWMFNQERRRTRHKIDRAAQMGFKPVPRPDPSVVEQILALHKRRPKQSLEVRSLFHKDSASADLYLYDLWDPEGESSTLVAESALAVILPPGPALPRMTFVPRLDGEGLLVRAANWSLSQLLTGLQMIVFTDCPEFNQHFFAAGIDEPAMRSLLTPDLRRHLSSLGLVQIETGGRVIALFELDIKYAHEPEKVEKITHQINVGLHLVNWFS